LKAFQIPNPSPAPSCFAGRGCCARCQRPRLHSPPPSSVRHHLWGGRHPAIRFVCVLGARTGGMCACTSLHVCMRVCASAGSHTQTHTYDCSHPLSPLPSSRVPPINAHPKPTPPHFPLHPPTHPHLHPHPINLHTHTHTPCRGPAPAHRHRARHPPQPQDPAAGRGHVSAGHTVGEDCAGGL
jgi:hypothetical protein